ncbi:YdcH family protein [Allorhizobium pseudoryzae]|uniref:YdcH family protein n=1 Tax=Allorhizobium pseudoryzae TaxID=379684 RepID=UPI0013EAA840|nr:YdcH family protein [Allorhizobium pseudoryzae]
MNPLLKALRSRHAILQNKIDREQRALQPDTLRIMSLKKTKLRLREQIEFLERAYQTGNPDTVRQVLRNRSGFSMP